MTNWWTCPRCGFRILMGSWAQANISRHTKSKRCQSESQRRRQRINEEMTRKREGK